jgi:hypothetical protein
VFDELVEGEGEQRRLSRRCRAAVARAAAALVCSGVDGEDLRIPVARAVVELAPDLDDEAVADLVAALLPIAARDLA